MTCFRDSDQIAGAVIGTLLGGTILVLVIIYVVRNYCHKSRPVYSSRSGRTIAIISDGTLLFCLLPIPRFITEISSIKICRHIIITILIFDSVSGLTMFYRGNDKTEMITVIVNCRVMRGYSKKKTLKEKIWYSLS